MKIITHLRKLPAWMLVLIVLLLLGGAFVLWDVGMFKTRLMHHCLLKQTEIEDCYFAYYRDTANTKGSVEALRQLNERKLTDGYVRGYCHEAIHPIGRAAFREFGSIGAAYAHADYSCYGGYLHGVVEASLRGKTLSDISAKELHTMCDTVKQDGAPSFAHFSCVHGVGHALMYVSRNDLPQALIRCDDLANEWETRQCANGAFMENVLADSEHPSKFQPKEDLSFPCTVVREKDRDVCYQVQSRFILDHLHWDFSKSFAFCAGLPLLSHRVACAQGLGAGVSTFEAHDPKGVVRQCQNAGALFEQDCLYGALTDLEGMSGGQSIGIEVCQNQPKIMQIPCFEILNSAHEAFPGTNSEPSGFATSSENL